MDSRPALLRELFLSKMQEIKQKSGEPMSPAEVQEMAENLDLIIPSVVQAYDILSDKPI